VHVLPVRVLKRHTAHTKAPVRLDGGAVHERSKKAGAHVVGCGVPLPHEHARADRPRAAGWARSRTAHTRR
jgi:hypothetical protein